MGKILQHDLEYNKESFIAKARVLHNNKYNYDQIEYVNNHTKIAIYCPIHGIFYQSPNRHLNSKGCNKCRYLLYSSINVFLEKAKLVHGDQYDYSEVNYINNDTPITIICKLHGRFVTRPRSHTSSKSGCPKCWKQYDITPIERAKIKFNNKFIYENNKIICPEHGDTGYNIHEHIKTTYGCKQCYEKQRRVDINDYIDKANSIHNYKYKYVKSTISNMNDNIDIICPEHGVYRQTAGSHLYEKKGCWKCSHSPIGLYEFINRSISIHGNKYDYSKVNYNNIETKVTIICPIHGEFLQKPSNHLAGMNGCKKCNSSKLQTLITNYLDTLNIEYITCDRNIIKPYEIDISIPSLKLGIEVHGNYYHSYNKPESITERNRHSNKTDLCDRQSIRLLQFYEHEILDKPELVKSMISHCLLISKKIYARKCYLKQLKHTVAKEFFIASHIHGYIPSTVSYGLYYNDSLVTAISFLKKKKTWEISRYATKPFHVVTGGFSKLLKKFINEYRPNSLITFADRRFSKANVYLNNGFELLYITKPNYVYLTNSGKVAGSRQMFQKHKLASKLSNFNPDLTEAENMFLNGYRRLWDSGHFKLQYKAFQRSKPAQV